MIRSLLGDRGRKAEESPQATVGTSKDLTTAGAESGAGVAERTPASLSPVVPDESLAEARLIRRDLLVPLRRAPRLRMLVLTYVVALEQAASLLKVLSELQRAGPKPRRAFWEDLQTEFGGMGLRPKLLPEAIQEFVGDVDDFDDRYRKVAGAAGAALNPNQSALSHKEALDHVDKMRWLALDLASKCKTDAETLMDELNAAVTVIFDTEARAEGPDDVDRSSGRPASDLKLPDAAREYEAPRGREKHVSGTGEGPDVHGHLLTSRREQHE
jgi:hypothetical protein